MVGLGLLGVSSALVQAESLKIEASAHLNAAVGVSSVSEEELATHAHDPNQNFSLQGLEVGLSGQWEDYLQFFVAINTYRGLDDKLDSELEEAFIKLVDLPLGLQMRAGRYMNRFGADNNKHLHSWDFVNADLVNTQFLGEEGLITEGVEFTKQFGNFIFDASYGAVLEHDHGHEEEGDDHGHGAENANFSANDGVWSLRTTWDYAYNDFHQYRWMVNVASGKNSYRDNRESLLIGSDINYTYRADGYEPGGQSLSFTGSWYYRQLDWAHEAPGDPEGRSGHAGIGFEAKYSFNNQWTVGARYDYIQGTEKGYEAAEDEFALEIEERERYSLALTRQLYRATEHNASTRLQFDVDELASGDQEQSIWLQFSWNWGGQEIR